MICRICTNAEKNVHYRAQERMFGLGDEFDYFECANCECLQIAHFPPDIARYYREDYYAYAPPPASSRLKKHLVRWRNRYAVFKRHWLGHLLYRLFPDETLYTLSGIAPKLEHRILDVGCGSGLLLTQLYDLGFRNIQGIDPFNETDQTPANGPAILKRNIHEVDGRWDLVMFHHSFEHMPDPVRTLQKAAALLKDSGCCLLRIPVSSSYAWRHYGVHWVQLDAPRHFFLHSHRSLEIIARQANLTISKVVFDSTAFQFWGSEQYKMDIPLFDRRSYLIDPNQSPFTKKQIASFARQAKSLNLRGEGDQAIFYLKPDSSAASPV